MCSVKINLIGGVSAPKHSDCPIIRRNESIINAPQDDVEQSVHLAPLLFQYRPRLVHEDGKFAACFVSAGPAIQAS